MLRELEFEDIEAIVKIAEKLNPEEAYLIISLASEMSHAVGYAKGLETGSKWLKDCLKEDK